MLNINFADIEKPDATQGFSSRSYLSAAENRKNYGYL